MKAIAIGADDAAVELKAQIVQHLESKGIQLKTMECSPVILCCTRTSLWK